MRTKALDAPLRSACPTCGESQAIGLEQVSCNLCGAEDSVELFRRGDLAVGLGGEFAVRRCAGCGLEYLSPRPDRDSIGWYYTPTYEPCRPVAVGGRFPGLAERFERRRVRALLALLPEGRLLDVGCAEGRFLRVLAREGRFELHGGEPAAGPAARARERHGLDVATGTLESLRFPEGHFDAVTFWDVLEHLHDPADALARTRRLLKPGGLLAASLPVSDSLDRRIFGRSWIGYEIPRHLYFFSTATLTALLAGAGFRVVWQTSIFGADFAFADQVRFALRARGASQALYGGATLLLRSRPWRLLAAPLFRLLETCRLATPRTFFARAER